MKQRGFAQIIVIAFILAAGLGGMFGYVQHKINQLKQEPSLGAVYPVAGSTYYLAGTIGSSNTSITLSSFTEPVSGRELTIADFGTIGYATIDPGSTKKEFISFTGVTQASSSAQATLTGVTRGIGFTYPYASSSALTNPHSGGTALILSNSPIFYQQFASVSNTTTITGLWTFNSTVIPQLDTYIAPTLGTQFAPKTYVDSVATSGAPNASLSTAGLVRLATGAQLAAGTATSTATIYLAPYGGLFNQNSSAANLVPVTNTSGKLSQGFIDLTQAFTFTNTLAFGSTTINKTLQVTGTSTFVGSTTFSALPEIVSANATATVGNQLITKNYLDFSYQIYTTTTAPASRATGTSYLNSTGRWMNVVIGGKVVGGAGSCAFIGRIRGTAAASSTVFSISDVNVASASEVPYTVNFLVPPNYYYDFLATSSTGSIYLKSWQETY